MVACAKIHASIQCGYISQYIKGNNAADVLRNDDFHLMAFDRIHKRESQTSAERDDMGFDPTQASASGNETISEG